VIDRSLEQGVDDYVEKGLLSRSSCPGSGPWSVRRGCRKSSRWKRKLSENNSLLRKLRGADAILLKILEMRVPGANDPRPGCEGLRQIIAENSNSHEKRKQIVFAALLHRDRQSRRRTQWPASSISTCPRSSGPLPPASDHRHDDHIHHDRLQGIRRGIITSSKTMTARAFPTG